MAASLRINELPTAVDLNLTDRFLVSDVEAGNAKTVTLQSLCQNIQVGLIDGYDTFTMAISDINETLTDVMGDFDGEAMSSLKDLHDMIHTYRDADELLRFEMSRRLDILDDRITTQLLSNSSNLAELTKKLTDYEDLNLQAGLATGFLYARTVKVGEN